MAAPIAPRSFRFDGPVPPPAMPLASLELTASDGTGLRLVSFEARAVVEDPLTFTELRLTFENPEPRRLEGRFKIGLPQGASVSRFAMKIGGQWQEGEVVERQKARRVYEDFLHRSQDPALLEHEAGNEFSARVFPIEAGERKEIILSYGHEIEASGGLYRLPLRGLPRLDSLSIRALLGSTRQGAAATSLGGVTSSAQVVEVNRQNWIPDQDFELAIPASSHAALRDGSCVVLRVKPELPEAPDEIASLLVLVDTSASRALNHQRQCDLVLGLLRALVDGAGLDTPLKVVTFDQTVEVLFDGRAGGFSGDDAARLRQRIPLGASDLGAALAWAAEHSAGIERVLLVTDGVCTAGDADLVAAARALGNRGVARLDAISLGGLRDDAALRRLVTAGLPRDGVVCDGDLPLPRIADSLTRATRSGLAVEVPGAEWVWPQRLDGVQPGDERLIYAALPLHVAPRLSIGGVAAAEPELRHGEPLLLERAWVKARIETLEDLRARSAQNRDVAEALLKQIIALSEKHRVLCAHTALLVLETDADYARHGISQNALADILTVDLAGMEVLHRSRPVQPPTLTEAPAPSKPAVAEKKSKRSLRVQEEELASIEMPKIGEAQASFDDHEEEDEDSGGSGDGFTGRLSSLEDASELLSADEPVSAMDEMSIPMPEVEEAAPVMRRERADTSSMRSQPRNESAAPPPPPPPPMAPMPAMAARAPRPIPSPAPRPPQIEERPSIDVPVAESFIEEVHDPISELLPSWSGSFRAFMELHLRGKKDAAMAMARAWRDEAPGDVLALVALGYAAQALGDLTLAARAFGSIIDLFPSRADLRRFAGELLGSLATPSALSVAVDTLRKAAENRPDHPSSHQLLGMALLRSGRFAEAFEALARGQARTYDSKFPAADRILNESLALAGAAWIRQDPSQRGQVEARLRQARVQPETGPSVRFVLVWETDANDVDFHIHDHQGGHAYFSSRSLPSGGDLYADVTQGYGPECFTIRNPADRRAYPYRLQAHYYSRGPMGYGMGSLQIIEHDGAGNLSFEERPYVIQADRAYIELGQVEAPLR
ncbi:MAG: hypothetical protein MUF64_13580 [Polyangiaceae bacterium]|nr:hypothetical protein [Polyangiaceae bacterium]